MTGKRKKEVKDLFGFLLLVCRKTFPVFLWKVGTSAEKIDQYDHTHLILQQIISKSPSSN